MDSLLNKIPDNVPQLLQEGAPIVPATGMVRRRWWVTRLPGRNYPGLAADREDVCEWMSGMALDLTHPTGRWTAAVWVEARWNRPTEHSDETEAILLAKDGANMTPKQIDVLARHVLQVHALRMAEQK